MSKILHNRRRMLIFVILLMILGTAAYAFAAGISGLTPIAAGEGETTINGYAVSGLTFSLDSGDPRYFDTLSFTLTPAATTVYAGMNNGGGGIDWVTCSAGVDEWHSSSEDFKKCIIRASAGLDKAKITRKNSVQRGLETPDQTNRLRKWKTAIRNFLFKFFL